MDNVLADKSSNLIDLDRNNPRLKYSKSRSVKQDKKSFRLNLPTMVPDQCNFLNEPNLRLANLTNQ